MIERFTGPEGQLSLITTLLDQTLVCHDTKLAGAMAKEGQLIELEGNVANSQFIRENGAETDLYLILAGHVSVRVKGREIATRMAGTHVGDMAMIDPSAPRSASVVAREKTVLLKIERLSFSVLTNRYPVLWRRLAVELANRLRQRSHLIHEPNPQPVIFIGSSFESLDVANAARANLKTPGVTIRLWKDRGVFRPSLTTIEGLAAAADGSDFAVLVLGADDFTTSRGATKLAPRDNIVLELGWFMGAIGRERTYVIKPEKADLKLPTDLLGVTMLSYDASAKNVRTATRDACKEISECIQRLHVK
jgi:CRP/FNR family transcriptional regulator, cyclic AMP receptor protein